MREDPVGGGLAVGMGMGGDKFVLLELGEGAGAGALAEADEVGEVLAGDLNFQRCLAGLGEEGELEVELGGFGGEGGEEGMVEHGLLLL